MLILQLLDNDFVSYCGVQGALSGGPAHFFRPQYYGVDVVMADPALLAHVLEHGPLRRARHLCLVAQ